MKKLNLDIQRFSSTNKTTNYELPQFVGTDKPTWLGDFNEAMSDIDAGMHKNATDISTMESDVANAVAVSSQASQDVAGLTSTVSTLSSNVTAVTTTANNAQSTATSALNTANTANGKADTNASAIATLNTKYDTLEENVLGLDGTILWENQNPTADFAEQDITLSSDDYDILEFFFRSDVNGNRADSIRVLKGYGIEFDMYSSTLATRTWKRRATFTNNTKYHFENCGQLEQGQATSIHNEYCVPLYVIGYKINIFNGN